ncbi:hypothetical protein JG677_08340, partial [Campylobacter sp. TTU-622]|nr:hypothetical protein [Campylobacter sp. TTU-622]
MGFLLILIVLIFLFILFIIINRYERKIKIFTKNIQSIKEKMAELE